MKRLIILALFFCALLICQVSAEERKIDHIETAPNSRIIYYTDGTKDAWFYASVDLSLSVNANAAVVSTVSPIGILDILEVIAGLISGSKLLFEVMKWLGGVFERLTWWKKYRKSRTPVVISEKCSFA